MNLYGHLPCVLAKLKKTKKIQKKIDKSFGKNYLSDIPHFPHYKPLLFEQNFRCAAYNTVRLIYEFLEKTTVKNGKNF